VPSSGYCTGLFKNLGKNLLIWDDLSRIWVEGNVEAYTNQTYLSLIPQICSQILADLAYAGNSFFSFHDIILTIIWILHHNEVEKRKHNSKFGIVLCTVHISCRPSVISTVSFIYTVYKWYTLTLSIL
jgi:hypothetical protein